MDCLLLLLVAGLAVKVEYTHWRLKVDDRRTNTEFLNRKLAHAHSRVDGGCNLCQGQSLRSHTAPDKQAGAEACQAARKTTS
jgi:hypothetical protein